MVEGSGLLANTFRSFKDNSDVIIFASGVSNSGCIDSVQFKRELDLVSKYKTSKKLFVYFSTSSIEDPFLKGSLYIKHKLEIEFYIKANFQRYLIVRLPNVVGKTKNPNTLINFVYNCVQSGEKINIQLKASRYLIDVEDIFSCLDKVIVNETDLNKTVNLIIAKKLSVLQIVESFETHLGKKIEKEILPNAGGDYLLEVDSIFNKYGICNLVDGKEYLDNLMEKYYSD
jgi:UDP-2-acetamido-2,6-beta-L-arabino-hexul-4-ose reductase